MASNITRNIVIFVIMSENKCNSSLPLCLPIVSYNVHARVVVE